MYRKQRMLAVLDAAYAAFYVAQYGGNRFDQVEVASALGVLTGAARVLVAAYPRQCLTANKVIEGAHERYVARTGMREHFGREVF